MALVQFALVAAGMILTARQNHPQVRSTAMAQFVADEIANADDPSAEVKHAHDTMHWAVSLSDDSGAVIAESTGQRPDAASPFLHIVALKLKDGRSAHVVYQMPPPPLPPSPRFQSSSSSSFRASFLGSRRARLRVRSRGSPAPHARLGAAI